MLSLLEDLGLGAAEIHTHALALQLQFIEGLERLAPGIVSCGRLLLDPRHDPCGQFLTFQLGALEAAAVHAKLLAAEIVTDYRGARLRFGFGIYQDAEDVERLLSRLKGL